MKFSMATKATKNKVLILYTVLVPVCAVIVWIAIQKISSSTNPKPNPSFPTPTPSHCEVYSFRLTEMKNCHPVLDCIKIKEEIAVKEIIGKGAVKLVKRGVWQGHDVAVNVLANPAYRQDFRHGLHLLRQLQNQVQVTQLLGACENQDLFITEHHPLGSADGLESVFQKEQFHGMNNLSVRFNLCQQYVNILHSLHSGPGGVKIMCDSNDLQKTLSQFLLSDNLTLILNDVDSLALKDAGRRQSIKCGHRELFGEFVAPEQLWPHEDHEFSDEEMSGYDEKVDIWKVPNVCDAFLGNVEESVKLRLQLLPVHLKCKSQDPSERPSAHDLIEAYNNIWIKLTSS